MAEAKRLPSIADMRKRATAKMYGEIREDELMCRMLEAAQSMRRPEGMSPSTALNAMDTESREWLRTMARAALAYFVECLNASEKPS